MTALRGLHRRPSWLLAVGAAAVASLAVLGVRHAGLLERSELALHDRILASRAAPTLPPAVQVILETEEDLQRLGHPLSDEVMVRLAQKVLADGAAALVMDKYRDLPVAPGTGELRRLLESESRLYWVRKMGDERSPPVPAPAPLEGGPRALCNDIIVDADGRVRRYLAYMDDARGPCYSVAFGVVRDVLARKGTPVAFDRDGSLRIGASRLEPLEPGTGPYATADMAGYQFALEYPRLAPRLRLGDVLDGKVAAGTFRDAVVLFGSGAISMRDFFLVPSTAADREIAGVELHAAALAPLWSLAGPRARAPAFASSRATAALVLVAALLAAASVLLSRRLVLALAGLAAMAVALHAGALLAAREGFIAAPLPAWLAIALSGALALALRALREQSERNEMRGLFGRQVSPEVAESIWQDRDAFYANGRIPEREVRATALFLDIRGFTTITEKLGKSTIGWLNRGLGPLTDIVIAHGGIVTRFVGDQIVAVYGVPVPRTDDAAVRADACAAVDTALAIRERLDRLRDELEAEGLPAIRVRIGINSGTVTQGAVGSSARFEFSVFGDAVNTAARLESYATEDDGVSARILVSESTRALCGERYRSEPLGSLVLKGKTQPVAIYRVHDRTTPEKP